MSKYDPSQIDSLKVDELREYAAEAGVELEDGATKPQIKSALKQAFGLVDDEEDEAPVKNTPAKPGAWGEKIVYVFISNKDKETGPVSIGLNGVRVDIVRNQWAAIKEKYAEVLENAKTMVVDPETREITIQHSYPHQIRESAPTKDFQKPKSLSF